MQERGSPSTLTLSSGSVVCSGAKTECLLVTDVVSTAASKNRVRPIPPSADQRFHFQLFPLCPPVHTCSLFHLAYLFLMSLFSRVRSDSHGLVHRPVGTDAGSPFCIQYFPRAAIAFQIDRHCTLLLYVHTELTPICFAPPLRFCSSRCLFSRRRGRHRLVCSRHRCGRLL